MTSGTRTRNPLILFEGNENAVSKPVARNPITQSDVACQQWTPKKPLQRNPILQGDANTMNKASQKPIVNHKAARNPIIADPNEFAVKVRDNNTYKDSDIFGKVEPDNRPHTTKAKHTSTFSSTIFDGPKMEAANRKKLVTDLSTDQLFGDYKDPPFKKKQPKQYDPNFANVSPEQRRYLEVFGNEKPPAPALEINKNMNEERNEDFGEKDPFSKKVTSLESNIFNTEDKRPQTSKAQKPKDKFFAKTQWDSQVCNHMVDNQRKDIDNNYAKNKKQEEFIKSNIFGESQDNLILVQKPLEFKDDSNADKRKQMRNYSDLFNLPQYENPNPVNSEKKRENDEKKNIAEEDKNLDPHAKRLKDLYSVLANDDLTKTYKETLNSVSNDNKPKERKFDGKNAKDLKQMELKSNCLGNGKDVNYDNLKDPVYYDLDLKGVNQDFEATKFKQFCATKGYHLVDFKANMDSLNTCNNGTGRLKIRLGDEEDLKEIKSKLSEMGMDIHPHTEKHELKHNYLGVAGLKWTDSNLAGEERRLHANDFIDAKDSKMKQLESNGDVFGSSQGNGKWDPEWKAMSKNKKALDNYTPENNVQALNWKKSIKNLDKMKNPMYKAGTNFQNQKLFSSTSTKMFSTLKY